MFKCIGFRGCTQHNTTKKKREKFKKKMCLCMLRLPIISGTQIVKPVKAAYMHILLCGVCTYEQGVYVLTQTHI